MPNDKAHLMLNSALVALLYGLKEIAIEVEDGQGLHEDSLKLRLGDMRHIFNEACGYIEQLNQDVEVQE